MKRFLYIKLFFTLCFIFCGTQSLKAMLLSEPNLRVAASASDVNGGLLLSNDIVEYTFTITNIGDDSATLVVLTDTIPTNTTYVTGSLKIDDVTKTDGILDDQAEYTGLTKKVTFRLGTLATSLTGGTIAPNASTTVKFRIKVNLFTPDGTSITHQASANYSGILVVDSRTSLSDSNLSAPGSQVSTMFVNLSPPSIALSQSVSPSGNQSPGTELLLTNNFTNSGGSSAQNFDIVTPVPANTDFKVNSAAANLSSTGLDVTIQFSNNNGVSFSYTPTSGAGGANSGYDRNVTNIRFAFTGFLSRTAPNNTGTVSFSSQIR